MIGQSKMEKGLRRRNLCLSLPKVSDVGRRASSILRFLTLESGAFRQLTCETSFNILSSKKERFVSTPRVSPKECAYNLIDGIIAWLREESWRSEIIKGASVTGYYLIRIRLLSICLVCNIINKQ